MSIVDKRLAALADDITFWKSQIVDEPHRADRLLDRLQLHLRERDHLLSLTEDERSRAHELWQLMDGFEFAGPVPDQSTMDKFVAIQDQYSAIVEVSA